MLALYLPLLSLSRAASSPHQVTVCVCARVCVCVLSYSASHVTIDFSLLFISGPGDVKRKKTQAGNDNTLETRARVQHVSCGVEAEREGGGADG